MLADAEPGGYDRMGDSHRYLARRTGMVRGPLTARASDSARDRPLATHA